MGSVAGAATVRYTALETFVGFHRSAAKYKLLIGGIGSGKSTALYAESIAFALEQPGSNMLLCRRYGPDIKDTIEKDFFELLPVGMVLPGSIKRGGGRVQDFTFPNGSHIAFRGLDDWTRHKSTTYCWIGIDEADEQPEENLDGISGRLRQTAPLKLAADRGYTTRQPMRRQICLASNPAGKNWLWKRFINPDSRKPNHDGFVSTTLDNPHLSLDYLEDLLSKDLAWVRRWVLCEFDEMLGAIYPQWGAENTPKRLVIPEHFDDIWMGFDPGTTRVNPSAVVWAGVDKARGRLIGLAEYQGHDMSAAEHAAEWRRIEAKLPGKVTWRTADPAAIGGRDRGSNMALVDIYRRLGFTFVPARSNRPEVRIPALGELIATKHFILSPACVDTAAHIAGYSWEDQLPSQLEAGPYRDKVKKRNDHLVDASQYLALRWVLKHKAFRAPDEERTDHEVWSDHVKAKIRAQVFRPAATPAGVVT